MIRNLQGLLTGDERVIVDARIHPVVFYPTVFYLFLALLVGLFFHWLVALTILILVIYPAYNAYISFNMTHLILTDKKVLSRVGFLTRDWTRMAFDRIENAYLEEPIVGRKLGYSTVVVSGVGQGSIAIPFVKDGDEFIKKLEIELEKNRTGK